MRYASKLKLSLCGRFRPDGCAGECEGKRPIPAEQLLCSHWRCHFGHECGAAQARWLVPKLVDALEEGMVVRAGTPQCAVLCVGGFYGWPVDKCSKEDAGRSSRPQVQMNRHKQRERLQHEKTQAGHMSRSIWGAVLEGKPADDRDATQNACESLLSQRAQLVNAYVIVQSSVEVGFRSGKSQTLSRALQKEFQSGDRRVAKATNGNHEKSTKTLKKCTHARK